ncbi:MAG: TOBE domain-containing protein [Actinomycetota bacterium]|nr:TOBE domain-containing protein [Actinomycetota bacterium]
MDRPQRLYRHPANLFVAGFIGSPAMKLMKGVIRDEEVQLARPRLALDPTHRPALREVELIVGIRPEAFPDAALAGSGLPAFDASVAVVEELGSETHVFIELDAESVMVEQARTDDPDDDLTLLTARGRALVIARVEARSAAAAGEPIRLAVDPLQCYLFSPSTGEHLLGEELAASTPSYQG